MFNLIQCMCTWLIVQGHMDPAVKEALHSIIEMRSMEQFCWHPPTFPSSLPTARWRATCSVCGLGEPTPTAHPLEQVWWRRSDAGTTPQVWRLFLLPACLWTVMDRREGMLHKWQRHRNQGLPLFTSSPELPFVRAVTVCSTLLLEVNDGGDHWTTQRACLCSETCS